LYGESGSVDRNLVDEWLFDNLAKFLIYDAKNILNMDETGLVYQDKGGWSLNRSHLPAEGVKRDKKRITVLLCCSATGEKFPPLFIGRSADAF